jgi:hypothetical protein
MRKGKKSQVASKSNRRLRQASRGFACDCGRVNRAAVVSTRPSSLQVRFRLREATNQPRLGLTVIDNTLGHLVTIPYVLTLSQPRTPPTTSPNLTGEPTHCFHDLEYGGFPTSLARRRGLTASIRQRNIRGRQTRGIDRLRRRPTRAGANTLRSRKLHTRIRLCLAIRPATALISLQIPGRTLLHPTRQA